MLTIPAFQIARPGLCLSIWAVFCASLNAQVDFNRQVRPILAEHSETHRTRPRSTGTVQGVQFGMQEW